MNSRNRHYRISPEVLNKDLFLVRYNITQPSNNVVDPCCTTTTTTTPQLTALTYVYSSMTQLLSGGTNGNSILTGLTIPIMLTETCVDIGYYSSFDGFVVQQDVMTNFIFTGTSIYPYYTVVLYNTSDTEFKKYLSFSQYTIDWGDGITQTISNTTTTPYTHTYSSDGKYTITMSGASPWGNNLVKKEVYIPFTGATITNPNGTAYFVPQGGSWSGTPLMYDYIFSGDSDCDATISGFTNFQSTPVIITGLTTSSLTDLRQYGNPQYPIGVPLTGSGGVVGVYNGPSVDGSYTAYTINGIDYYDFRDRTTIFIVSGVSSVDYGCELVTKDEMLLNVAYQPELQSNVFVERGKVSGLERIMRLGEVDNIGDIINYGYGFFNVINR